MALSCLRFFFLIAILLSAKLALGSGFAHSENFIVFAPDQTIADDVLKKAESLRQKLAIQWFGEELPTARKRTVTSVIMDGKTTHAEFWAIQSSDGKHYKLDIVNFRGEGFDAALAHEITHLVMEFKFDGRLPVWADEGLATFQSDQRRVLAHASQIRALAETGHWPALRALLDANRVDKCDRTSYAAANSFTTFLLHLGETHTLFQFALSGTQVGWRKAAQNCYAMSLEQLEESWHQWVLRRLSDSSLLAIVSPPSPVKVTSN